MKKQISIVYHSNLGHTKRQAEAVARGAGEIAGVEITLHSVDSIDWEKLDSSDALIMGCPTYMGSASAEFKSFIDKSSKRWVNQDWKNKLAAGFTNSGSPSGDKLSTLLQLFIFAMQHSMIWVGLGIASSKRSENGLILNSVGSSVGAMATSSDSHPSQTPSIDDLETAAELGRRVAKLVVK
jgi:multimeric flavodoxin WrbA